MPKTRGAYPTYPRTCERCGAAFRATKVTARFCSVDCSRAVVRYGRTYGQYEGRALGETKG